MSWKLYEGDCFDYLPTIEDGSIDMILCDLPYGTTACKWDTPLPLDKLWTEYKRVIKDNGAIVLTASQPFTTRLISSNYDMFRYEWIWEKNLMSNFFNASKMPLKQHENVLIFYFKQPTYNPIKEERTELSAERVKYKVQGGGLRENSAFNQGIKKDNYVNRELDELKFPSSVQKIRMVKRERGLHPTQKPVALFEYLIKTYTNENDLVLDNCAGSGTTGVACENLNRNSILMEQELDYCQIIRDRMATTEELKLEARKQQTLQAFSGQQTLTQTSK
jgi:site-specific DNA-methyltransferase (adenine-specific)